MPKFYGESLNFSLEPTVISDETSTHTMSEDNVQDCDFGYNDLTQVDKDLVDSIVDTLDQDRQTLTLGTFTFTNYCDIAPSIFSKLCQEFKLMIEQNATKCNININDNQVFDVFYNEHTHYAYVSNTPNIDKHFSETFSFNHIFNPITRGFDAEILPKDTQIIIDNNLNTLEELENYYQKYAKEYEEKHSLDYLQIPIKLFQNLYEDYFYGDCPVYLFDTLENTIIKAQKQSVSLNLFIDKLIALKNS